LSIVVKSIIEGLLEQTEPMNAKPHLRRPASNVSIGLRILAFLFRALFLGALVVVTARVSSPQSETIWSVYETPGDLIRVTLGFAVCLWLVVHVFMLPKDSEGYRSWLYFGPLAASLAWVIAIAKW
jgi:hypothetical protein